MYLYCTVDIEDSKIEAAICLALGNGRIQSVWYSVAWIILL